MNDFEVLMRELHKAHRNFQNEWRRWCASELTRKEKQELISHEVESVTIARNMMLAALDKLFDTKIYPLESELRTNPQSAADKIIEFLSVDIPAFRCGYAKEFLLARLKYIELNPAQKQRLRQIALNTCEAYNFRREFRRWCRLMIVLADRDFTERLINLTKSGNRYAQIKSKWMLDTIFRHRKDLTAIIERQTIN
jgi:hypothetical protein